MRNVGVKKTLYKIYNLYQLLQKAITPKCGSTELMIERLNQGFPSHINGLLHGEGICPKKTWHVVG